MLRGREPADCVGSPGHRRTSARWAGWGIVPCVVLVAACSGRGEGATGGMSRPSEGLVSPWKDGIGHVGNEVRGIEAMPDYDAEAARLRLRVEPWLPQPLPTPEAACVSMLDGARQYYGGVEGEGSPAVKALEATHEADLGACIEETSPAAAACAAVMMSNNEGELPWVLDQCSRAFPSSEG
jgi:hypothetical protein